MGGSDPGLTVGVRLIIGNKHRATVKYIGSVDGQQGEWVGLEWDDISRGKHNGTYEGKWYFDCTADQPAGSFVRLAKLLQAADFGGTIADAALSRYSFDTDAANTEASNGALEQAELYVPTTTNRRVPIQLIGAESHPAFADFGSVRHAALVDMQISHLGSSEVVTSILGNIEELDLSLNLLSQWSVISQLLSSLPRLASLNLSDNVLAIPSTLIINPRENGKTNDSSAFQQLPNLKTLVLNRCRLNWEQVVSLCSLLPGLKELHLCGNRLRSLQVSEQQQQTRLYSDIFKALEVLDLEENCFSDWAEIESLSGLPNLRVLQLSNNSLCTIPMSTASMSNHSSGIQPGFSSLESLTLGGNKISDWASVDALDTFHALHDVRLSDTPLTTPSPSAARYEIIARIGKLQTLNGSTVSHGERWDAELTYLRYIVDQLAATSSTIDDTASSESHPTSNGVGTRVDQDKESTILSLHPRYPALTARYGQLAPTGVTGSGGSTLAKTMAEVLIRYNTKEIKKKLPVSLTIGKLKLLLEKLFRVKASEQKLVLTYPPTEVPPTDQGHLEEEDQRSEDITHEDGRELRIFDLVHGCIIQITKLDAASKVAALQQAQTAAEAAHLQRMEQQERELQQLHAEEQRLMVGR